MDFLEGYRCGNCGRELPAGTAAGECPECAGPLLAVYDTGLLRRSVTREEFFERGDGVWRFRALLPSFVRSLSLGEGGTPLLESPRIARRAGCGKLWIKDESLNPTGSFKARGLAVAVSRALELGAGTVAIPSAGNAGLALAAYSAAAGIRAKVFMPSCTPPGFAGEAAALGADVRTVAGILPDAAAAMADEGRGRGWVDLSTFREPCRVEGKKTIAFEIEDGLEADTPDWIVFPTGGGTGVVAVWKAYGELDSLGWLDGGRPRIAAVQSKGCAPLVEAFEAGADRAVPWIDPETCACGIRVPSSRADRQILEALRESGGAAVAVTEEAIREAALEMGASAGTFPSPEGAAALAGLYELAGSGRIEAGHRVVVVNTAGWSRYRFMLDWAGGGGPRDVP